MGLTISSVRVFFVYFVFAVGVLTIGLSDRAFAYDGQATVGAGTGYAYRIADSSPNHGAGGEINISVGLNDIWTVRGLASYYMLLHRVPVHFFCTGIELFYLIDIVEIVPFFGAGFDGVGNFREDRLTLDAAIHGVVGIDYLLTRRFFLGLQVRPFLMFSSLDDQPGYLTAMLTSNFIFDL